MKKYRLFFLFVFILLLFSGCVSRPAEGAVSGDILLLDSRVHRGVLENGLTWFVRENRKPQGRASLRLVVRAGSVLEDEDQQGFAHLVEHMAFNGTENFEKMEIVNYLESIGMAFGPEINAYTGFDETVYMLEIPTDDTEIVEQAFQILEEWAHRLSFDEEEIRKERGVVREEWRLGRGASGRILDQLLPVLLSGSRYAERLPIGKMESVMETPSSRLRDFYRSWYRPDLMAVIVAGDLEAQTAIRLIGEKFSSLPAGKSDPGAPPPREYYPVPVNSKTEVLVISDPEVTRGSFELSVKTRPAPLVTRKDYRRYLARNLFWNQFNARLGEIARGESPPFIGAGGGEDLFVATRNFISYNAAVNPREVQKGLDSLLLEIRRASLYGLTPGELERGKADLLTFMNNLYRDRDNLESYSLAEEIKAYYLYNLAMPGVETEWELFNQIVPGLTLEEINSYAREILPGEGRVLTVILPVIEGLDGEILKDRLAGSLAGWESLAAEPYDDRFEAKELVETLPEAGTVLLRETIPDPDIRIWTLSNGARVIFKKTDFREEEVLFHAYSPGGLSLVPEEESHTAAYAPLFLQESGLGNFSAADLQKLLSGKQADVSPYIGDFYEGFNGRSASGDVETLFQLIYLYFTSPLFTAESFENVRGRLEPSVANRLSDPGTVYQDRLNALLTRDAFRARPLDSQILASFSKETAERIFRERFASPGDFTFFFVGNIDEKELESLAAAYLGSLSGLVEPETFRDTGIRPPEERIDETIYKGLESKGQVTFAFTGLDDFEREDRIVLGALGSMLQTRLREIIREDLSGTYSIGVRTVYQENPAGQWRVLISFGCDPERTEELSGQVLGTLEEIRMNGLAESYFISEKEQFRRAWQKGMKENPYWISSMVNAFQKFDSSADEPLEIFTSPEEFDMILTPESLKTMAGRLFSREEYIRLVLKPREMN